MYRHWDTGRQDGRAACGARTYRAYDDFGAVDCPRCIRHRERGEAMFEAETRPVVGTYGAETAAALEALPRVVIAAESEGAND